jgi:hypothetical protein
MAQHGDGSDCKRVRRGETGVRAYMGSLCSTFEISDLERFQDGG